jgi:hypothetical protein
MHFMGSDFYVRFAALKGSLRDVAQPGSAFAWGARGRWFESSRPDLRGQSRNIPALSFFIFAESLVQRVWITISCYGSRDHLVVFTFLRPKYLFNSEKFILSVSLAIFVLCSLINPTESNFFCSFFTVFSVFIINNCLARYYS